MGNSTEKAPTPDKSISAEFESTTLENALGKVCFVFVMKIQNNSTEQIHIKIPLTSYKDNTTQVRRQIGWSADKNDWINGSKGISLPPGGFCRVGLRYAGAHFLTAGDHLDLTIERAKPLGSVFFTFECTGVKYGSGSLLLSKVVEEVSPELAVVAKNSASSTAILKRVARLEEELTAAVKNSTLSTAILKRVARLEEKLTVAIKNSILSTAISKRVVRLEEELSEVSRRLDAMLRDFSKLEALGKAGSVQTLAEVFAWLAIQDRVGTAEMRARLLPLNVLPNALVNQINELALDITGELALEEVGNHIVVTRKTLGQILGSLDVPQFEKRISS